MENYSLSDLRAATEGSGDMFGSGNGGIWIFALLVLCLLGGGGLFGGRGAPAGNGEAVTESGLCNAMNFNNLENAVGRLSDQNQNQTMTLSNGLSNLGYEQLTNISNLGKEVALGQANLQLQASNNTAGLTQQIAAVNANVNEKFAALEKSQLEQTIAAQQNQLNQLYLAQQMAGVVRYPMSYAYSAGPSPFCGSCCNSTNI